MKKVITLCLFVGLCVCLHAQNNKQTQAENWLKKSELQHTQPAIVVFPQLNQNWDIHLKNYGISHGEGIAQSEFDEIKKIKTAGKASYQPETRVNPGFQARTTLAQTPTLADDFQGNRSNGSTPPDNHMAISDSGFIVSVTNTRVYFYTETGTQLDVTSLGAFDAPLNVSGGAFDPRVLFDADSKRFIMCWLAGSSSAQSDIVLAVSQGQDPRNGWYLYALDATILNNGTWMDFPNIGVNANEIFITGNMFTDFPNAGFDQVLLFQVDKDDATSGAAIDFLTWNGVGSGVFTLVPLSYGYDGAYGPEMHFLSNTFLSNNSLGLFTLSDSINGNPSFSSRTISISPSISIAGNGQQLGSNELISTGGDRLQSGFVGDSLAHIVFTTDYSQGFAGVYYARINLNTNDAETALYGQLGFDCAFPAVAPFSNGVGNPSVLIGFLRTGETIYPQIRAVVCDEKMDFSGSVLVKKGETFLNTFINGTERWGDYSGISRRHNAIGAETWVAGCFARPSDNFLDTWIGRLSDEVLAAQLPDADFVSTNPTIGIGESIQFSDESTNGPTTWNWSCPGGVPATSTDQNPVIQYNTSGVYPVTLTVSNGAGTDSVVAVNYVTVTALPITDFTADRFTIAEGMTVNFSDLTGNAPTGWFWLFNGGTPSAAFSQNPSIEYNTAGTYDVSLNATNAGGSFSEQKVGFITVVPLAQPIADFTSDTTVVPFGGAVQFIDQSQNFPTSWKWLFPGGTPDSSLDQNPLIFYNNPGTYNVTLSINNAAGTALSVKNGYITVLPNNPQSIDENISSMKIYPNPVRDERITVDFYLEKPERLSFRLIDIQGKEVKVLARDMIKAGQNHLNFVADWLSPGTYTFLIEDEENKVRLNEKIVILP